MNTTDRTGSNGGLYLTAASGAKTGLDVQIIEILEDGTTFSVLDNRLYADGEDLTTRTWKRGDHIRGRTTAITLSAGQIHCLKESH